MYAGLTSDNADFLRHQVASGEFGTSDEALNAAVNLMRRRVAFAARFRQGVEQLARGEYLEVDDQGLDRFFDELFAKAGGDGPLQ
jgi:Arc/MetJ-type ribon-helix-helix transcriptional regulator